MTRIEAIERLFFIVSKNKLDSIDKLKIDVPAWLFTLIEPRRGGRINFSGHTMKMRKGKFSGKIVIHHMSGDIVEVEFKTPTIMAMKESMK